MLNSRLINLNKINEKLKELYYSEDDTGSYGGVERLYRRAVEDQVPHITRNAVRDFYRGSGPTLSTNPQNATFTVMVSISVVSTNNNTPTQPKWSDFNVKIKGIYIF